MPQLPRPLRLGGAALLGLATIALTGSLTSANAATAASPPAASSLSTLRNSLPATTDPQTGSYSAPSMTVEVALAPQNQAGLNSALQAIYTEGSSQYHQFLSAGQFDAQYAPSAAERASVAAYLAGEGLTVASTSSPFLLSVTGSSAKITAAFHTSLSNYVDPRGIRYFQNSRTLQVPTSIVSDIQGVVGLTNTVREHSGVVKPLAGKAAASSAAASASCETGYVTKAQLFAFGQQRHQLPVRLRRRPRLQRPHPVADQLHLRRARRQPGNPGRARQRRGLRAVRLPGVGHRHLGEHVLRPRLHAEAEQRQRGRRPAGPGLPGRRHLPAHVRELRGRHRGRRPTSRTRWPSPRTPT